MISPEIIEEIRQKADIVDVISTYINVIKKGNSFLAVCPFHNDKNPSLQISRSKQIYKCFSCGAGGNVFTFVQEYEKISFIEAVKKVAKIIGYENKQLEGPTRVVSDDTKLVLEALEKANEIYTYTLKTAEGEKALEYLKKRNISLEMSDYFSLGFCPSDGELSIKLLRGNNISIETLDKAGLISRTNNQFLDHFKGRLTFAIFNEYNEVIGFSARRIVNSDEAKYVNSVNSIVFNKSKVLYNYQNAIKEAKKEGFVYVTEGFMDVFSLYQAGVKSSVALMGTAFTSDHAKMLKKLNVEVRLCLDGDEAGQHGMLKMIDILDKENIKYRVVNYKDCQLDPDEILQKYGVESLKKFLNRLITREEFIINYYLKKFNISTVEGKRQFVSEVMKYMTILSNELDQEIILKRISELTSISYDSFKKVLDSKKVDSDIDEKNIQIYKPKKVIKKRYENVKDKIIRLLLNYSEAIEDYMKGNNYFYDDLYDNLVNYIIDCYEVNHSLDPSELITFISSKDDELSKRLVNKIMEIEDLNNDDPPYSESLLKDYLKVLKEEINKIKQRENLNKIFKQLDNTNEQNQENK